MTARGDTHGARGPLSKPIKAQLCDPTGDGEYIAKIDTLQATLSYGPQLRRVMASLSSIVQRALPTVIAAALDREASGGLEELDASLPTATLNHSSGRQTRDKR